MVSDTVFCFLLGSFSNLKPESQDTPAPVEPIEQVTPVPVNDASHKEGLDSEMVPAEAEIKPSDESPEESTSPSLLLQGLLSIPFFK